MPRLNRQWTLSARPTQQATPAHFMMRDSWIEEDGLQPGEVLVKNLYVLCAPSQRNWMRENADNHPAIALGGLVTGPVASQVIASAHPDYPVGRYGFTLAGWQEYARLDLGSAADTMMLYSPEIDPLDGLTVFGINAVTAYLGMKEYGRPLAGETMLVSGAAGSVGSVAAQIGSIAGCRVVGLAGSDEKCRWLVEECGIYAAINYRTSAIKARLAELCPDGINIFFDNVGGDILHTVIAHMAVGGRVVLCGAIAGYNGDAPVLSADDLTSMIYRTVGLQGYNLTNFLDRFDEGVEALKPWVAAGRIAHREDVRDGFETLPAVYAELFEGTNAGTLVVRIGAPG